MKSVQLTELALYQEYWKEMTVNSITKQHSQNLTKKNQESIVGCYREELKMLTPFSKTTTNKLTKKLGKWIDTHSKSRQWLSYQDQNRRFYTRVSNEDIE